MVNNDLDYWKKRMQAVIREGMVIIIGSGLSAAYKLPTMWDLSQKLTSDLTPLLNKAELDQWIPIQDKLEKGENIEIALKSVEYSDSLLQKIVKIIGDYVEEKERMVFEAVFSGKI